MITYPVTPERITRAANVVVYATNAETIGIDVSHWNNWSNPAATWEAGARFVIVRLGSIDSSTGVPYVDYDLLNYLELLRDHPEFAVACYWYARLNKDLQVQADAIAGLVEMARNDYGVEFGFVAIDIETAGRAEDLRRLCLLTEEATDKDAIIYTNPNTWLYLLTGDKSWAAYFDLWQAQYRVLQPTDLPHFSAPKMWQYSADGNNMGREYGCESDDVDLDKFFGDEATMRAYFGSYIVEPEPQPERVRVTATANLIIRDAPAGERKGYAAPGSVWVVYGRVNDANGREWVEIAEDSFIAGWYTDAA